MTKQKLLNLFSLLFLAVFGAIIFDVKDSPKPDKDAQKNISEIKSGQSFSGKTRVIDGDSIVVANNRVRLLGIDAPEHSQNCLNQKNQEYPCGKISGEFLSNLVGDKEVICFYKHKDIYNRFLGNCFIQDLSINEEILKNGMAVIYSFTSSDKKMNDLELFAKEHRLGIWQGSFQLPKEYRKSKKNKSLPKKT